MTESPEIPVELDTEPEPDDDGSSLYVHIGIVADKENISGHIALDTSEPAEAVANAFLRAALMVAHAYNSDVWMALQHLINREGQARPK